MQQNLSDNDATSNAFWKTLLLCDTPHKFLEENVYK